MLVEPRKVAQREGLGVLYLLTCSPECKPENMCRRGCIIGIHDTEGKYESYRGSYEVAGVCFCLGDYLETDILCLCEASAGLSSQTSAESTYVFPKTVFNQAGCF